MELRELKKRKKILERLLAKDIRRHLEEFREDTGMHPDYVNVDIVTRVTKGKSNETVLKEVSVDLAI